MILSVKHSPSSDEAHNTVSVPCSQEPLLAKSRIAAVQQCAQQLCNHKVGKRNALADSVDMPDMCVLPGAMSPL